MKKSHLLAALFAAFALTSCDKSKTNEETVKGETTPAELKIAYVEVDSIMTQYQFCKDYTQILTKKGQNIENTIQKKGEALQSAITNFQQKLQQNTYTREQAESIQMNLQKQDADLRTLQQRLATEFQTEQDKFNVALRDSIKNYLAKYNKEKKYSIILSKQGENLLYADKTYDITAEIIEGLNKAYKPANVKKEQKEEKK